MPEHATAHFEATHCTLDVARPSDGVVILIFKGHDIGEFGDAPFN